MKETRVELTEAINSSAGMAHINRVHHRTFSLNIFKMNAQELIHAVRHVRDPDYGLQLMAQNNKEAGNQAHREINRLVHNFVAASKSLIDHTRVFIDTHYAHTSLAEAYQERITGRFANDPVSKFVQDLRNYMLHKGLPNSAMYIHFSQNPENAEGATLISGVHFSAAELLEWNGWTAPARAYILAAGEYLELPNFAEEYLDKVLELQNWLEWELEQFHATDLAVLGELEKERAGLYDEVEPTLPTRAQVNAVPIARFEFPKDVETFIDTAGQELLSAITELELSPRSATGFASERPKVLLTGDEIIEPPGGR